jgi:signal transduction histidine kinase
MRTIAGAATAIVLLVLLTLLYILGLDIHAAQSDRAVARMERFVTTESALRENLLAARSGLLRDYDPIDEKTTVLHTMIGNLRQERVTPAVLAPLAGLLDEQDKVVEQFKSDNALLQNSLAYFGALSGRFDIGTENGPLDAAVTALAASMLHLVLDTSPAAAADVEARLAYLAQVPVTAGDAMLIQGLLAHGRVLHDLLPAADHVLRQLYSLPIDEGEARAQESILAYQSASRQAATRYRLVLYGISAVLVLVLVQLGLRLRRHVLDLRRRANFEHRIAAISMRFINAGPDDIGPCVEWALEELSGWIGAERAYLLALGEPSRSHVWSDGQSPWPDDWPREAPKIAEGFGTAAGEIFYAPVVERLPDGPQKAAAQALGLRGWIWIPSRSQDETATAIGFESLAGPMAWNASDLVLLRMAADTVGNAFGRARLERERIRLEASLEQARRMETVGALTSGVAHNFNNIIGAILGHTEMQEEEVVAGSRMARHVQGIRLGAERARDLVEQILTFGRRRASSRSKVNLQSLMAETASLLAASLRDPRLIFGEVPDAAIVYGEAVQLQQVIINLCNNAVQATEGAGNVVVTTAVDEIAEKRRLSHGQLPPGPYVRIAVRDAGRGIDAATQARLFEPFFTTRLAGNGLGLATVREIVASHHGAIDVSTQVGEGTVFAVWLPQATEASAMARGSAPVRGNGQTVLIVDDDTDRLLRDEEIIAALGYEPIGYSDPAQALAAYGTSPARFDAALIGHLLPVARGVIFARTLHGLAPRLPILLSAAADEVEAEVLAAAGIRELVSRPLVSAELAAALSRCLSAPAHASMSDVVQRPLSGTLS